MTSYAVEHEMACRLEDVYRRRTGLMLFSRDNGRRWLERLADEMSSLLGWSPIERGRRLRQRVRPLIECLHSVLSRSHPANEPYVR
jgi:glycerol-3-phosphate dehydrogenase